MTGREDRDRGPQQVGGAVGVDLGTTVTGGPAGACARLRLAAGVRVADGCAVGECEGPVGFAAADADAAAVAEAVVAAGAGAADDGAGVGAVWVLPAPYI